MPQPVPKSRQHLSADALLRTLKGCFQQIPDHRPKADISLSDALLSGFALFALKDPSLLAFEQRRQTGNLQTLYGITRAPSDTRLREILDPVDPDCLRPAYQAVFRVLQRGKALERFVFHDRAYLLALDGTGYYSSTTIYCDSCLEKINSKTGEVTYSHQLLGASIVHPDLREVIPLAPEPIIKQDGSTKNDCERNASTRLLRRIREEHPHLKFLVIEDGLASNAPHIEELIALKMNFLLGAKPGDHAFLFDLWIQAHDSGQVTVITSKIEGDGECEISFAQDLPLNESHLELRINFLQVVETDANGNTIRQFSWVTDLAITPENAAHLARGGRARWKIENETFNTLKNQGYHFEHDFGHGKRNLSVVFAMLMMLAFLVDQVQQLCCPVFQAVLTKVGSKRLLWEQLRSHFYHFVFESLHHLYWVMLYDLAKELPAPSLDTS